MKIGYAIKTTPKRFDPERNYFENTKEGAVCYLHNDVAGLGGPSATNICIRELYNAGCDIMILMDDDTRILNAGLTDLLIKAHELSGIHHFTFPGSPAVVLRKQYGDLSNPGGPLVLTQSQRGSGVLLFVTRTAIEKVGYLNTSYPGKWGHSHIGWSIRILRSGLIPGFKGWRISVEGIEKYFWSDDIQGKGITPEGRPIPQNYTEREKNEFMRLNLPAHNRENRSSVLYYPFSVRQTAAPAPARPRVTVHYLTPGRGDKNIGRAYNDACALIPDGDWICIRDQDCLIWPEFTTQQVEDVIAEHGTDRTLFGCMTNRLASTYQRPWPTDFENMDMRHHFERAKELYRLNYGKVVGDPRKAIAGVFLLFPKALWNRIKFEENNIACDTAFCRAVTRAGGRIGLLAGVYCMHWYRAQSDDPTHYKEHLMRRVPA